MANWGKQLSWIEKNSHNVKFWLEEETKNQWMSRAGRENVYASIVLVASRQGLYTLTEADKLLITKCQFGAYDEE